MRPWMVAFGLLGCVADDDVAYIQVTERVQAVLNDQTPSRTWDVHVETNANALRDGPTWTTVSVDALVTVGNNGTWNDVIVDATLTSDEESSETLSFTGPAQAGFGLLGRYQADCLMGAVCEWDYPLVMTRREGQNGVVAIDFDTRALVTLGPETEAPEGSALSLEIREITAER